MAFSWNVPIAGGNYPSGAVNLEIARGPARVPDLSQAVDAFTAGADYAQKQRLQNLFSDPSSYTDAQGNLDYQKMARTLLQAQGAGAVGTLAALRQGDIQQQVLGNNAGGGGYVSPIPQPRPNPAPVSTNATPAQAEVAQPVGDTSAPGGNVVRADEVPGSATMSVDGGPQESIPQFRNAAATVQEPVSGPPADRFTQVAQLRAQQPQPVARGQAPLVLDPSASGYWTMDNAQALQGAAIGMNRRAEALGAAQLPAASAAAKQQAEQWQKQAEQIRNVLSEGPKENLKGAVSEFRKEWTAIQQQGQNALTAGQKIDVAKQLVNQPGFYSGPLSKEMQTYQQFKALFGENPSSALPMEAFNKVAQDMLQEQIKSMGQSGVGRVLQAEVGIMRQAIAGLGITPASNRALLEIQSRVYQKQAEIAQLTRGLSASADPAQLSGVVQNYLRTHPLFNNAELRDPRVLGAPTAPPGAERWTPAQGRQWGANLGLKPGDPVRLPNGQIMAIQ